jgi:hypothetical protein
MTGPNPDTTLARLLGPGAAEATCDACFAELDAYVERELAAGDAAQAMPQLAAHLRGCPACAEDHASLLALAAADDARRAKR